jgi:hypothetical protein
MDELEDYIWLSSLKEIDEYETHINGIMDELEEVEQMMKLLKGWSWMMVKLGNDDGGTMDELEVKLGD